MFRMPMTFVCFLFALAPAPTGTAQDADDKRSLADDLKALQGVWQSSSDAKKQLKIMFMDNKIGFDVTDPKAKPGERLLGFLGLSTAQHKEVNGKRHFHIDIAKDYAKRVDYRYAKSVLVVGVDGADYKVERANARASSNSEAKRLVGTWTVTGIEQHGRRGSAKDSGLEAVVFTEDRYIMVTTGGKQLLNSFYRLDAAMKPAAMDWFGMKPSLVIPFIYELKEDKLRLAHPPFALAAKGAKRPKSFDTKNSDTMLIRAERSK